MGTTTQNLSTTAAAAASVTFAEDLSPHIQAAYEQAENDKLLLGAEGNIPSLQVPPTRREDGKGMKYRYNHFVTGEPQQKIEELLQQQRTSEQQHAGFDYEYECDSSDTRTQSSIAKLQRSKQQNFYA